jgi:outer membrane lipoprotein-sorting protein
MFRLLLLFCVALPALASEERAREIIDKMEQLYRGESSDATMTMQVQTPNYDRTLTMSGQSFGKDYGFFRIHAPKKDRGVATLKRHEEMWNYFPKINKVIKVPPSMMMGSWMGSDFTNDDLVKETQLIDAYSLELIETDDEYRVTLIPKEQTVTVWDKIEYTISKDPLLPLSQAFFDDDGEKVRELTFHEPREYDGKLMPSILEMRPLNKEGHLTRIMYDDIKFNVPGITEDTFSLRNLKSRF